MSAESAHLSTFGTETEAEIRSTFSFSKNFQTRSDYIVAACMDMFNCLPYVKVMFCVKFSHFDNSLCQICCSVAPIVS